MDSVIDHTLDRLLHRRSYLALFLEDPARLGLSPDDLDALTVVDRAELVATATAVRHDVMARNHRGSGTLLDLYPQTIGDRTAAAYEELVADFMESEEFDAYREIPFAGIGLSLEESFYRYCVAQEIGDPATREHEFLTAMMKALLLSPRPDFQIPSEVRACPRGVFAVAGTTLHAALDQKLVTGPLTPLLVDLLNGGDHEAIANRLGVSRAETEAALAELRALGLVYAGGR
jgi:hypothetical protein